MGRSESVASRIGSRQQPPPSLHCPASREIHIKTELDADALVRVTVRDSGVGFDSRDADKLFEAFFSTKPQAMGIGLSVSRSIVESHHGRIWAIKNEGPGATFAFAIPCGPTAI